jgi:hypothetical protein
VAAGAHRLLGGRAGGAFAEAPALGASFVICELQLWPPATPSAAPAVCASHQKGGA